MFVYGGGGSWKNLSVQSLSGPETASLKIALGTEMPSLSFVSTVGTVIFVMFVSGGGERIIPTPQVWR